MYNSDDPRFGVTTWHVLAICLVTLTAAGAEPGTVELVKAVPVFVETGPRVQSVLHSDGRVIEVETQTVWRAISGSDTSDFSVADLEEIAAATRVARAARQEVVASGGVAGASTQVFDLVFDMPVSIPDGAAEAFAEVEQFVESQFTDPVTVTIDVDFAFLGPGILGSAANGYALAQWPEARDGLQLGMDLTDGLQDYLPSGSTIPVRYDAHSEAVTDETRVWVSVANYRATIGSVPGSAGTMTFNTYYLWDYTPPIIDLDAYSFQDVLIHEIGHILGFTSGADSRAYDIEMLDIYRFQRSDGNGTDFNPDTLEEFTTTARMVDRAPAPPLDDDDVVTDLISIEYRMADGSPSQASHFTEESIGIYLMTPSFRKHETLYPNFYRSGDLDLLDAIGWDYPPDNTTCDRALDITCGSVRHYDNSPVNNPPNPPYSCGVGALHDGTLWFSFVATANSARLSTCGSREPDSTIAVYEGECGSLVEIACSEDYSCEGGGALSTVCLAGLVIGETYYVQTSAATSFDRGVYSLEIECSCDETCADVCRAMVAAPQAEPNPVDKNRYISIVPGNPGRHTAVRVILSELQNPSPPNVSGSPSPDFTEFEGQIRWVGPPETFEDTQLPPTELRSASLQCTEHFRDWGTEGVVHVRGPEIMPSSTYVVQTIDESWVLDLAGEGGYSEVLTLTTARWGDVAAPFQDPESLEPPSQPNVLDVASIVDHLKLVPTALSKTRVQLRPDDTDPSSVVNVLDVASCVDAVKGGAYPHAGPVACPP